MKYILTEELVDIPEGVEIKSKCRDVEVKGPLGTLKKSFKHVSCDIKYVKKGYSKKQKKTTRQLKLQMWLAKRMQRCQLTSVASQIKNMVTGVKDGYKFKMRYAYAHFPIQGLVTNEGKTVEIKNFLGEKVTRKIDALEGVTISKKEEEKDQITLTGTDLNNVSLTCALINQACKVPGKKDIRQFLDGIYVSDKRLKIKE